MDNNKRLTKKNKNSDFNNQFFKEDISSSYNYQQTNPFSRTQNTKTRNNNIYTSVIGNREEEKETILQSKIKHKQLNGKTEKNERNSRFISESVINKPEFRESLKDLGIFWNEKDEFLKLRNMPKISQENFNQLQNSIINREELTNLCVYLNRLNCNFKSVSCDESVGGLSPLTYLIESSFEANKEKAKEMNDKYNTLKPYIYNYRMINRDGNCFYRAVMFRFLEILILNNKIEYLQNIIFDIMNSFKSVELQSRRIIKNIDVKPDLTLKILILIVDLLKNGMKDQAHQILVKSFCTCKKFDYAIILYFRYILYDYIKKNENKIYLKTFPVKIGNLLPNQFETEDGKFLFDSFYKKYLLNFFFDAEKIIIYLTPFVLGIELNVIIFNDNEDEIVKKFRWEGTSELQVNDVICLLNNRTHYEIIYSQNDYEKNKSLFAIYENHSKSIILSNIDAYLNINKENVIDDNDNSEFNILQNSSKNVNKIIEKKSDKMVYKKNIIANNKSNDINNNGSNKKVQNINNINQNNNNTSSNNMPNNINNNPNSNNMPNNINNNHPSSNNITSNTNNNNTSSNNIPNNTNNNNTSSNNIPNNQKNNNANIINDNKNQNNKKKLSNRQYNNNQNNNNQINMQIKDNNPSNNFQNNNYNNIYNNNNYQKQINNVINNNNIIIQNNANNNKQKINKGINSNNNNLNKNPNNTSIKKSTNDLIKSDDNFNNKNNREYYNINNNQENLINNIRYNNNKQSLNKSCNPVFFQNKINQVARSQINQKNNTNKNYGQQQNNPLKPNKVIVKQNNNIKNSIQLNQIDNNINYRKDKDNSSYRYNNNKNGGLKTPGEENMQQSNMPSNIPSNMPSSYQNNAKMGAPIGLCTPGSNMNMNKEIDENKYICIYCKEKKENNNIDICKKCFKSKIIDELYSSYLECLEKVRNPMDIDGNIQLQLKNHESPKNLALKQALEIYNKIYSDDKFGKEQIIKELKKKLCVLCQEDIRGEGIILPCDCHLCNKEELDKFLSETELNKGFICECTKEYTREMIFDLAVLTYDLNIGSKKIFIRYFNSLLNRVCCNCGKTSNINYYSNDFISSKNEKNNHSFLKELKHKFCGICFGIIQNTKIIDCKICKRKHFLNKIIYIIANYK